MNKKMIKQIAENGCNYYGINTVSSYIKGDKLDSQINLKSIGRGLYIVTSDSINATLTAEEIVALTK